METTQYDKWEMTEADWRRYEAGLMASLEMWLSL